MKDVKCKLCINYKNEWCSKVFDSPVPDMLRDCQYFSHMTNADRIRKMTDEELAESFTEEYNGGFTFSCPVFVTDCTERDCRECLLEWLKQRVSE